VVDERLAKFEPVSLGHWPTPVEPLTRLSEELGGANLWIKRDDCSGLGFGGNKVRKLEFLVSEAKAAGADTLITVGAVQSNHARQTAAAAAKCGLRCHLILPRLVRRSNTSFEDQGNPLLDHLFGAKVHFADDIDDAMTIGARVMEETTASGGSYHFIPPGGSTAIGTLGFVSAALELCRQEEEGQRFDRIVVAASTGGTLAGLNVGFALAGRERPLDAIMVFEPAEELQPKLKALVDETAALLDLAAPGLTHVTLHDGYLGDGYGLPTRGVKEALLLTARKEGIVLDPVYTGKAMAGLFDLIRTKKIARDENVLFWHTGGAPALFAYPEVVES
jgi:D-cysteine desulfhydrase family pyridoxal phosphate-dependent enzyme